MKTIWRHFPWGFFLALGMGFLLGEEAPAALRPVQLRCEYLVEPLAMEVAAPRLSWVLESAERGQVQSAYQVLAATSLEKLSEKEMDLWNSGVVRSDQSIQVVYAGKRLASRMRVHWKVRVWDGQGRVSGWSEPAFFQMGLLEPEDWQARWISVTNPPPVEQPARNGFHSVIVTNADVSQWVGIDLGRAEEIDGVALYPARPFDWKKDEPGFLFPARFRIEVSDNAAFVDARVVADRTGADVTRPELEPVKLEWEPVTARYFRLVVTRLSRRDGDNHAFALAELEVLRGQGNVAAGRSVLGPDSLESGAWSRANLVDGVRYSQRGMSDSPLAAPMLRRAFALEKPARRATVYATALGLYELRLNGQRVGDQVLTPEWTDYLTRVQYQAYDVTSQLRLGNNVMGLLLGDGWYAGRLGMSDGIIRKRRGIYGAKPYGRVQLEIETVDGARQVIVTDPSWRGTVDGPIRAADLLDGEVYDARREMPGWDGPGFSAPGWHPVEVRDDFRMRLVAQPNEPMRIVETRQPVALTEPKPGVYVFDLGQNMVGWVRLRVSGAAGTEITLRHGEMLQENGRVYVVNLRGAPQVDRYILREGSQVFEPRFTCHGFRYVEITGCHNLPARGDLTGRVLCSAAPEAGSFECAEPMLNQLWQNILWTQRGNLTSVPTDCPQRDERLGWMGDIQAFSQTAIFNMDLAAFFTKWLQDVRDAQADDGRFPDFAPHPYGRNERFTGVPAWGDAGVFIPWRCYVNYGDTRLLAQHFESARRWIEFIRSRNPDLIWRNNRGNDYNDWLNGDTLRLDDWPAQGGAVPNELFATAFFARSTALLSQMARILEREEEARAYETLSREIRSAFNAAFVGADGRMPGDTQAGYALALHFDLLPDALRTAALQYLTNGIAAYRGHHSTGIQTTHRLLLELTREGEHNRAWQLITNRTCPSWGFMIENGATTIWERWDGFVRGRGFQDPGMNSFNHWALGSVGEWIIRHLLGIQPDEDHPGYAQVIIHPRPPPGLQWARGHYDSIRGRIRSEWVRDGDRFSLKIAVPANVLARVHLPATHAESVRESGRSLGEVSEVRLEGTREGQTILWVGSGDYSFSCAIP